MAGKYTPKSGIYAGREFASYRQYLNTKSKDEGYSNFNQRVSARKITKETIDRLEIKDEGNKTLKNGKKVHVYSGDNITEIFSLAETMAPNAIITIIVETTRSLGNSKNQRLKRGFSTLVNATRVSMFKKLLENKNYIEEIYAKLYDIDDVLEVVLWVK